MRPMYSPKMPVIKSCALEPSDTDSQRELAALLDVAPREVPGTHVAITTHPEPFVAALLDSLSDVRAPATLRGR